MYNRLTLKLDSGLANGSKIADRLVREAYVYDGNERERFVMETGWEDWMPDYIDLDDPDDEPTEHQLAEIDDVLNLAFDLAHEHPLETAWELANLDIFEAAEYLSVPWDTLKRWEDSAIDAEPDATAKAAAVRKLLDYKRS